MGADTMKQMMGPLQMAVGAGLTATGQPQFGIPLLAGGVGQTATSATTPSAPGFGNMAGPPTPGQGAPQSPYAAAMSPLMNPQLMGGVGQLMAGGQQQQPQQPPQMPQRPPQQMAPPMPSQQSVPSPQLAGVPQPGQGGGQLSPQLLAVLQQMRGMG